MHWDFELVSDFELRISDFLNGFSKRISRRLGT
jgi:hypothetical protein